MVQNSPIRQHLRALWLWFTYLRVREWMSGTSELANGRSTNLVLTPGFWVILTHKEVTRHITTSVSHLNSLIHPLTSTADDPRKNELRQWNGSRLGRGLFRLSDGRIRLGSTLLLLGILDRSYLRGPSTRSSRARQKVRRLTETDSSQWCSNANVPFGDKVRAMQQCSWTTKDWKTLRLNVLKWDDIPIDRRKPFCQQIHNRNIFIHMLKKSLNFQTRWFSSFSLPDTTTTPPRFPSSKRTATICHAQDTTTAKNWHASCASIRKCLVVFSVQMK